MAHVSVLGMIQFIRYVQNYGLQKLPCVYTSLSVRFALFSDPPFVAQETLRAWQEKNHPWLELSDVHKETTENIRVTVIPFYMGYRENQNTNVYWVSKQI